MLSTKPFFNFLHLYIYVTIKEVNILIIEKITLTKNFYEILFSDRTTISVCEDTLVRFQLYKGMEVEDNFPQELEQMDKQMQAFNLSAQYLSRPKSSQQIRDYLYRKQFDKSTIESTILQLQEKGYLNDVDFALRYLRDAQKLKKIGKLKIRHLLSSKGISSKDIHQAFVEYDEELEYQNCKALLQQKYTDLPDNKIKQKAIRFLMSRGFSYEMIISILEERE